MIVKMKYWTLRLSRKNSNKYEVRLDCLKLELGLFGAMFGVGGNETLAIDVAAEPASWNPTSRFNWISKRRCVCTPHPRPLRKARWDSRDLRDFRVVVKGDSSAACDIAFHVLYGERSEGKGKAKTEVIGNVSMKLTVAELEEMQMESDCQVQRKLPIELRVNGLCIEASLSVSVSFVKLTGSRDSSKSLENRVKSDKKNNGRKINEASRYNSSEFSVFDSDDSFTGSRHVNSLDSAERTTPKNKLENTVQRGWTNLSWNQSFNGLSFRTTTPKTPSKPYEEWQVNELRSRDGEAKLNTNVFFASFDQRSEEACGESACATLVTIIAHWLHSNQDMPSRPGFDSLITKGSSEWRMLCDRDDAHLKLFPDKHFDLDTVIEANLTPLVLVHEKSYTGFFSPEKFECLKGAMSFDEIWDEISRDVVDCRPRIYIVSWNDHFFVLKVEADAYYIIDSLGERLFEGCKEAFILKFDDSSLFYGKVGKAFDDISSRGSESEKERFELVCRGKECCKEFIKKFLAALPLKQLEEEEKKESIFYPYLHRLLQIEFHYTSLSFPSSASSTISSPFSSGALEAKLCR